MRLTLEEMMARIAKLPLDEQDAALECAYAEYVQTGEESAYVVIGEGTEHEMRMPASSLMTLDEWSEPGWAAWRARVPADVAAAWEAIDSARVREAEETLTLFADDES